MKTSSRTAGPVETKTLGISESKARSEGGSAAATRPFNPPFPGARDCTARSSPSRDRLRLASRPGRLRSEPGDWLFMRERGELQRGGDPPRMRLRKGAVLQPSGPERHAYACSLQGLARGARAFKTYQFTHSASGSARLSARSNTDHERHLSKSSSHFIAGEPGSNPGSRRMPSQGVWGGGPSTRVSILRFRKAARACKAVHRASEPSIPSPTPKLTRETPCASSTWKQGQRPPGSKTSHR